MEPQEHSSYKHSHEKKPRRCAYYMCNKNSNQVKLHPIPANDISRAMAWIYATGNLDLLSLDPKQLARRYVCGEHFESNSFMDPVFKKRLMPHAVPIQFHSITSSSHSSTILDAVERKSASCKDTERIAPIISAKALKVTAPQKTYTRKRE